MNQIHRMDVSKKIEVIAKLELQVDVQNVPSSFSLSKKMELTKTQWIWTVMKCQMCLNKFQKHATLCHG